MASAPNRPLAWWPLAAAAAAAALTVAVMAHPGPLLGDEAVVDLLQRLPSFASTIADAVLAVTSTEAALVVLVPLAVVLFLRSGWRGLAAALVLLAAMLVVQPGLKDIVDRPRPDPSLVEVRADSDSESYPSGHSLSTTAVWATAAAAAWGALGRLPGRTGRRVAALLCAPIVLTGLSSLVQGTHWPSDVVGGTLVGVLAAWCALVVAGPGPVHRLGQRVVESVRRGR
jgi:membrane-associated phospholipid phosphatase